MLHSQLFFGKRSAKLVGNSKFRRTFTKQLIDYGYPWRGVRGLEKILNREKVIANYPITKAQADFAPEDVAEYLDQQFEQLLSPYNR